MKFDLYFEKAFYELCSSPRFTVPSHLKESMEYSLFAPGKRIRPRLCLESAKLLEVKESVSFPIAVALEMFHCFSLIHDDLPCMDNDDTRRGKPSNHIAFGEALALLAGDGLLHFAIETISKLCEEIPPKNYARMMKLFFDQTGPRGVLGGQAQEFLLNERSHLNDLLNVYQKKTGALFYASIMLPAETIFSGTDSDSYQALDRFAWNLGLAFQVTDDLEDAQQDSQVYSSSQKNILDFLERNEAIELVQKKLVRSNQEIRQIWNDRALPLIEISQEVLKRMN